MVIRDKSNSESEDASSSGTDEAETAAKGKPQQGGMSEYEKQRMSRIAENRARLEALGLPQIASTIKGLTKNQNARNKKKGKAKVRDDDDDEEYRPGEGEPMSDSSSEEDKSDKDEDFEVENASGSRKRKQSQVKNKGLKKKAKVSGKKHCSGNSGNIEDDDEALMQAIALSLRGSAEAAYRSDKQAANLNTKGENKGNVNIQECKGRKKNKKSFTSRLQMTEDELIGHFFQLAETGNGTIMTRDLQRAATAHDFIWTDKELADMIRCFDSNGDGKMTCGNDRGRGKGTRKVLCQKKPFKRRLDPCPAPSSSSPSPSRGQGSVGSTPTSAGPHPGISNYGGEQPHVSADQLSHDHPEVQRGEEEALQREMDEQEVVATQGNRNMRRRVLSIENNSFVPSTYGVAAVRNIVLSHYKKCWPRWSSIDHEDKAIMFKEFMRTNEINCDNLPLIESVFYKRASSMLRSRLDKARRKGWQPYWVPDDVWKELLAYWNSDEFKKDSAKNKANRRGGNATPAATHTGGSLSITQHRRNMIAENNGVEPSLAEVFLRTHSKQTKDGIIYVSDKARDTIERYQRELAQRLQSTSNTDGASPIDERQVWIDVAGHKKGRTYGVGTDQPAYRPRRRVLRGSGSSSTDMQRQLENLMDENRALKETMSKHEEERRALQETIRVQQEMMARHDQLFQQLLAANPDFFQSMGPPGAGSEQRQGEGDH